MRRLGLIIVGMAALALLFMAGNFIYGWHAQGPSTRDVTVVIKKGSSLPAAARALEQGQVVISADAFIMRAKVLGGSTTIKAGEFLIPAGASNADIMSILQGGKTVQKLVTIPEGMPSIMVYERLMANEQLTGEIEVPAEGSVMPNSYAFEKGEARANVLKRMQAAMTQAMGELWPRKAAHSVVNTQQEALTLASIVEKETALKSELRKVAGVYSNRLRINMPLQADPTIIYPITKGKPLGRPIRKSDIGSINDYNTYTMTGMPKGPIANPSRAAIEAVLNPEKTTALYFVANGKGGHTFADTLEEHKKNVEVWRAVQRERGLRDD